MLESITSLSWLKGSPRSTVLVKAPLEPWTSLFFYISAPLADLLFHDVASPPHWQLFQAGQQLWIFFSKQAKVNGIQCTFCNSKLPLEQVISKPKPKPSPPMWKIKTKPESLLTCFLPMFLILQKAELAGSLTRTRIKPGHHTAMEGSRTSP